MCIHVCAYALHHVLCQICQTMCFCTPFLRLAAHDHLLCATTPRALLIKACVLDCILVSKLQPAYVCRLK